MKIHTSLAQIAEEMSWQKNRSNSSSKQRGSNSTLDWTKRIYNVKYTINSLLKEREPLTECTTSSDSLLKTELLCQTWLIMSWSWRLKFFRVRFFHAKDTNSTYLLISRYTFTKSKLLYQENNMKKIMKSVFIYLNLLRFL